MNIDVAWLGQRFTELANLAPLSVGGQKLVFSAVHPAEGDVVLKIIHPRQDTQTTARELLAVNNVSSPRVPRILAEGTLQTPIGDCVWFREQRIIGQSVRQILAGGPFAVAELLRLGLHTLEALEAAERAQIVHRDVKPDNILRAHDGEFWLLDFGLARHLALPALTATADPFGKVTWGYAPPEQSRNLRADIDARADLFALGVTLFECATGANPFRQGTNDALEMLRRVETQPLPRLKLSFNGAEDFTDLVAALTQKQCHHRPPNVAEALSWMREICDKQGTSIANDSER